MKKVSFILLLSLFFVSYNIEAQKAKAILTFNDGTKLEGLGKLKGASFVKFRKDKNTKAKKYHFKDLERVEIYSGDAKTTYVYLLEKEKNKYKVLEEVVIGDISLYKIVRHGTHAPMGVGFGGVGGMGMGMGMGAGFTIKNYYLRKKHEKEVTHISSTHLFSKNFKKAATSYFEDCPDLVEKIATKEYRKRDIRAVIEFYNAKCKKR
jgi:CRISPR/Cas system-associated endonuclease/helicase Cas3